MVVLGKTAFDIGAFFVILFCLTNSMHFKREYKTQKNMFRLLLLNSMVSAVMATAEIILTEYFIEATVSYYLRWLAKTCFFLTQVMMAPIFMAYIMCITGVVQAVGKKQFYLLMTPNLIVFTMVLLNFFTKKLFYYDDMKVYHRGVWLYVVYIDVIIYVIIGIYILARYKRALERAKFMAVLGSTLLATACATVELYFPDFRIEIFGESLCYLSLLLNIEIDQFEFDPSTELFNRTALSNSVNRRLLTKQRFIVVHVHFINMKFVTGILPTEDRQRLVLEIAKKLDRIDTQVQCYSTGDNEFALVLPNDNVTLQAHVIGNIKSIFSHNFKFEGKEFTFRVIAAILKSGEQFKSVEELVELLDMDLPDEGKRVSVLADDDLSFIQREGEVAKSLQNALTENRLEIYYQPIWAPNSHKLYAAEALSRLTDDVLGPVSPDEFIPVAERNGMIIQLGDYVMEHVCSFLHDFSSELSSIEYIEVNLSVHQLLMSDLPERFSDIMMKYGIRSDRINLEITESAAGDSSTIFEKTLNRLRDMGFDFSLDDFGTGYSNMARLFGMDFRNVKIDKSLLWNVNNSASNKEFLESMVSTIHNMGSNVIQEGVETEEQLQYMKDLECDLIQGFYYSKALSPEDFVKYVLEEEKKSYSQAD